MTGNERTSLFATTMFLVFGLKALDFNRPAISHNLWAYIFLVVAVIALVFFVYYKINR